MGGYRLYDAEAVARLDLVRTLRELGLDLDTVRRILANQATVRDVAGAHLRVVDAEIRRLQVRRAVLRWVVRRGSTTEEMRLMHELARMSAGEWRRMIDDFVSDTFDGLDTETPGAHIAQNMRTLPAELPDEPAPEQVEAWIELAELVRDEAFRKRAREMALDGARADERQPGPDPERIQEHAGGAVRTDVAPVSAEGAEILSRIVDPGLPAPERLGLADQLATFTEPAGGAVLAAPGHAQRLAAVAAPGAGLRVVDRRPPRLLLTPPGPSGRRRGWGPLRIAA